MSEAMIVDAVRTPTESAVKWIYDFADGSRDILLGLAKTAFTDPSMRTNPRIPLTSEIIELLQIGFAG